MNLRNMFIREFHLDDDLPHPREVLFLEEKKKSGSINISRIFQVSGIV